MPLGRNSLDHLFLEAGHSGDETIGHVAREESRRHRVHIDPLAREIRSERARELMEATLGGAIGIGSAAFCPERSDRSDITHPRGVALTRGCGTLRQQPLDDTEGGAKIDAPFAVPLKTE